MADKKKAVKAIFKAGKKLTGDALKRERARRLRAARAKAAKAKEKKSTEENMEYLMDSGQRKYDPKTGMVMNKGGLANKRKKK